MKGLLFATAIVVATFAQTMVTSVTSGKASCTAKQYYSATQMVCKPKKQDLEYCNAVQKCMSSPCKNFRCQPVYSLATGAMCFSHSQCTSMACIDGKCADQGVFFTTQSVKAIASNLCGGKNMGDIVPSECCESDAGFMFQGTKSCIDNGMGAFEGWMCSFDGEMRYLSVCNSTACGKSTCEGDIAMPAGNCLKGGQFEDTAYFMLIPRAPSLMCPIEACGPGTFLNNNGLCVPGYWVNMVPRAWTYEVFGYTIENRWSGHEELRWTYLKVPSGAPEPVGTTALQNKQNAALWRTDISPEIVMAGWYEAPTGTQVLDLFDLKYGRLFANMYHLDKKMANFGTFSSSMNSIRETTPGAMPAKAVDFTPTIIAGRRYNYVVADPAGKWSYTIDLKILSENSISWEYTNAPTPAEMDGPHVQTVKNNKLFRRDVSPDVIIIGWSEEGTSGAHVVDVFNLKTLTLYTSFGYLYAPNPSGAYSHGKVALTEVFDTAMTGRSWTYEVFGYTIENRFLKERELRWSYLVVPADAPEPVGTNALQNADNAGLWRIDINSDIVMCGWYEAPTGTQVLDLFDVKYGRLFAHMYHIDTKLPNFGTFSASVSNITETTPGAKAAAPANFSPTRMTGRKFNYVVAGVGWSYTIVLAFPSENSVTWEYTAAPTPAEMDGPHLQTVKDQQLFRRDISPDVIIFGWSEAGTSGSQVVDVFDLKNMILYTSFGYLYAPKADGAYMHGKVDIAEVR